MENREKNEGFGEKRTGMENMIIITRRTGEQR